jgi:prevent-host-death family protein
MPSAGADVALTAHPQLHGISVGAIAIPHTMCYIVVNCSTLPTGIRMRELSIREMRERLGSLDRLVQGEGEIIVTRRGVPIARLLPVAGSRSRPNHAELRAAMPKLNTASETIVRDDRDQR